VTERLPVPQAAFLGSGFCQHVNQLPDRNDKRRPTNAVATTVIRAYVREASKTEDLTREPAVLQHLYTETTRFMPRGGVVLPSIGRVQDCPASEWKQNLGRRRM
jgi:hypothetical protein